MRPGARRTVRACVTRLLGRSENLDPSVAVARSCDIRNSSFWVPSAFPPEERREWCRAGCHGLVASVPDRARGPTRGIRLGDRSSDLRVGQPEDSSRSCQDWARANEDPASAGSRDCSAIAERARHASGGVFRRARGGATQQVTNSTVAWARTRGCRGRRHDLRAGFESAN
jgi:hypothetical protein